MTSLATSAGASQLEVGDHVVVRVPDGGPAVLRVQDIHDNAQCFSGIRLLRLSDTCLRAPASSQELFAPVDADPERHAFDDVHVQKVAVNYIQPGDAAPPLGEALYWVAHTYGGAAGDDVFTFQTACAPAADVPAGAQRGALLDIYCGAGGLTAGLLQSAAGASIERVFAVDPSVSAGLTYLANHPHATLFHMDVPELAAMIELLLAPVQDSVQDMRLDDSGALIFTTAGGAELRAADAHPALLRDFITRARQQQWLPLPGQVWLLAGKPPPGGASTTGEIVRVLQPQCVVLDATELVRADVLALTQSLLASGYQVRATRAHSAQFCLPQNSEHLVVIATRAGVQLPRAPLAPSPSLPQCLRDALSDLPPVANESLGVEDADYLHAPQSALQELVRTPPASVERAAFARRLHRLFMMHPTAAAAQALLGELDVTGMDALITRLLAARATGKAPPGAGFLDLLRTDGAAICELSGLRAIAAGLGYALIGEHDRTGRAVLQCMSPPPTTPPGRVRCSDRRALLHDISVSLQKADPSFASAFLRMMTDNYVNLLLQRLEAFFLEICAAALQAQQQPLSAHAELLELASWVELHVPQQPRCGSVDLGALLRAVAAQLPERVCGPAAGGARGGVTGHQPLPLRLDDIARVERVPRCSRTYVAGGQRSVAPLHPGGTVGTRAMGALNLPDVLMSRPDVDCPVTPALASCYRVRTTPSDLHPWQDRSVTARELARFQAFPDHHVLIALPAGLPLAEALARQLRCTEHRTAQHPALGADALLTALATTADQLHTLIGNAVPPPIARAVGDLLSAERD